VFGFQRSGFRVWAYDQASMVWDLMFRVTGLGFGFQKLVFRFWVLGFGFWVQDLGIIG
jgi:hypothetical protein